MPEYNRPQLPGAPVYFTVCLAARGTTLLTDEINLLRASVQATLARRPFHIDAWVVLPDHMHAVWTLPDTDRNFSERWGAIKAHFSKHLRLAGRGPVAPGFGRCGGVNPALRKGEVGIWQKRFREHHIRDRAELDAYVRHCWKDPVRHGLADCPENWPYSSVHRDIRMAA